MSKIPIGVQLYSVREDCAKDFPGTLKAAARMGYAGVEFAGYYEHSAKDLRKMLDDLNIRCCGTHTKLETLLGDQLSATIEYNKILGNPYLIVPWLAEDRRNSRAALLKTANLFNELAEEIKPEGMFVGYHNHSFEFQTLEGEMPFDTFFGNTKSSVLLQVDTGNALHGGADSVPFLKKYPGRSATVHLKEYSKANPKALIGEGDVKWQDVFSICESSGGTKWYIVEQESYPVSPLESIDRCLQNLKKMGK